MFRKKLPNSLVDTYWWLGRPCCFYRQGRSVSCTWTGRGDVGLGRCWTRTGFSTQNLTICRSRFLHNRNGCVFRSSLSLSSWWYWNCRNWRTMPWSQHESRKGIYIFIYIAGCFRGYMPDFNKTFLVLNWYNLEHLYVKFTTQVQSLWHQVRLVRCHTT